MLYILARDLLFASFFSYFGSFTSLLAYFLSLALGSFDFYIFLASLGFYLGAYFLSPAFLSSFLSAGLVYCFYGTLLLATVFYIEPFPSFLGYYLAFLAFF